MPSRKLLAIMFTDIQGYTALMQKDEEYGMKVRARHREIFESITPKFGGTIVQYFGDGTLSVFNSAIDAVSCGIELQQAFLQDPAIPVRIGIHLGDIVLDEVEVIGDSVNVASRIESLAVAGSVFISEKVWNEIRNHPSIESRSMGPFEFKNVELPMEVYAISSPGLVVPGRDQLSGKIKVPAPGKDRKSWVRQIIPALALLAFLCLIGFLLWNDPEKKVEPLERSIAVLPFDDMSEKRDQGYFSDGITEDIITHLSKVSDLRVISRTSTKKYKNTDKTVPQIGKELGVSAILEGSVRRDGDQLRITAQLIDAATDEHIWAEVYDREVTRIFDIQTEVARKIAGVLQATLTASEEEYLEKALTSNITAYDFYLRGKEALENGSTQEDFQRAAQIFRQALGEDPQFAAVYVELAKVTYINRYYGAGPEIWRDSALSLTDRALSLDPKLDEAHYFKTMYDLGAGEYKKAQEGFQKVLAINPNHAKAKIELGKILMFRGDQYEEGLNMTIDGLLLELDRKEPRFYYIWGLVYKEIGEYEKAKQFFRQAIKLDPDHYQAYDELCIFAVTEGKYLEYFSYAQKLVEIERNNSSLDRLAWAHLLLGNYEEAEKLWRELSRLVSGFDDLYYAVPYKHRLAYVMWKRGRKEAAMELFEEIIQDNLKIIKQGKLSNIKGEYYDLAAVYAFLDREEEALKWFQVAADRGFFSLPMIGYDPMLDSFRDNARFQAILEKKRNEIKADQEKIKNKRHLELAKQRIRELERKGILQI